MATTDTGRPPAPADTAIRRLARRAGIDPDISHRDLDPVPLAPTDPAAGRERFIAIVREGAHVPPDGHDAALARTLLDTLLSGDHPLHAVAQLITTDIVTRHGTTRTGLADQLIRVTDDANRPIYDTVVDARVARSTWAEPVGSDRAPADIYRDEITSLWIDQITYTCILLDILDADSDPDRRDAAKEIFAAAAYDNDPIGICLVDCAEAAQLAAAI